MGIGQKKLGLVFTLALGLAACAPNPHTDKSESDGRGPASVDGVDVEIPDFGGITVKNISVPIGAGDGVETVYVPAVTKMVTKRVMTMPAAIMERTVPAVTQQVNGETVIVQESVSETVTIPATFEHVEIEEIIEPERVETRPVTAAADARPQLVQVAVNPFSWDEIAAAGGRRPPEFIPPATLRNYIIKPELFSGREGADVNLKVVHDTIMALIEAEEDENFRSRLFSHPNGFVVLTSPERIDDDAKAIKVDGNRIGIEETISAGFGAFLRSFFLPEKSD